MKNSNLQSEKDIRLNIHAALRAWQDQKISAENSLADLLLVRLKRQEIGDFSSPMLRRATNLVLQAGLEQLRATQPLSVKLLERHFVFGDTHAVLARDYKPDLTKDMIKSRQAKTIEALTAVICTLEEQTRISQIQLLLETVPSPTSNSLFGVVEKQQDLVQALLDPHAPHVLFVTGIGGIGKTSLTNAVAREVLHQLYYEVMIWIHVSEGMLEHGILTTDELLAILTKQLFPEAVGNLVTPQRKLQIRQTLAARPHLIVIDNLETEITADLVNYLHDLADPSSFLITSRMFPPDSDGLYHMRLDELPSEDALAVVRHHARHSQMAALATFGDAEIAPIYEIVGGNPLAIRLVTSLAKIRPLSQILADLKVAKTKRVEDLYRKIYWQAWEILPPAAQKLLMSMFTADEMGVLPDQMAGSSQLDDSELWQAIDTLVRHCLLEVRGTIHERRYGIHRLTASFLQTEIIHWPKQPADL